MPATVVMAPLDASPAAEAALPWAVFLAKQGDGEVRLVGVHAPPAVLLDGETLIGSIVPDDAVRTRETDYFSHVQARLAATGVRVAADLVDGGVISSLTEYAQKLNPAWVVMLSHARGPVARFFLGETAHEFVRSSPCPVLLVHEHDGSADPAVAPVVNNVLVALDGSPLAERMVEPATKFAKAVGAKLTLLTAQSAGHSVSAEPYLESKATELRAAGFRVHTKVVAEGDAATAIVAEAELNPGTVVALATHGRGGLSQMVWGSVADAVVRRAPCPVLVFKPTSLEAGR